MKYQRTSCLLAFLLLWIANGYAQQKLIQYVNPLIGTQRMGHTYPGATYPFGMVQLSPDTDTIPYENNGKYNPDVYKYCAGYQYDDKTIVGFSHTHFSGTGHADLGDFLTMPTIGPLQLHAGTADNPASGYRSTFSHQYEKAEPGYYQVKLDKYQIKAELTATPRVGVHQYTFPASNQAHIILDFIAGIYNYEDKNVWTAIRVVNDTLITGYRQTNGWARNRTLYFAMTFSKPFRSYGSRIYTNQAYKGFWRRFNINENFPEIAGRKVKMYVDFTTGEQEKITVKTALSSVSMEGAIHNLMEEAAGHSFEALKQAAQAAWEAELGKVEVKAAQPEMTNFYTALYHTFINPTVYMDVDGRYKGLDQEVHQAQGFTNYTTFSLWDTYRALHPWFNIIQPKRNADMIQSMLAHYNQSVLKMLPIWSNSANENWCMTGYHAVSVVADAIIKEVPGFDYNKALEACVATANQRQYDGLDAYINQGYIPVDKNGTGASTTLEYAYDDWTIAQAAKKLGQTEVYHQFMTRSENYKNVFDAQSGFMRGRLQNGTFKPNFDPLSTNGQGFIEGNSWNYSLFVPHQPRSLMALMGGQQRFIHYLDTLFSMHLPDAFFAETEDITRDGIIGGYVHGNEPAHHVAFLYNWTNQPWKTQSTTRMILTKQYHPTPDGLGGNDDTGQMSAWYIFASLGFYPWSPGSDEYAITSPAVMHASLHLENGKTLEIEVKHQSPKNVYIQQVTWNGMAVTTPFIKHSELMKGGKWLFELGDKPNTKMWTQPKL